MYLMLVNVSKHSSERVIITKRFCFRFAEQQGEGKYVQQDASECWTELVRTFEECLPPITAEGEDKSKWFELYSFK